MKRWMMGLAVVAMAGRMAAAEAGAATGVPGDAAQGLSSTAVAQAVSPGAVVPGAQALREGTIEMPVADASARMGVSWDAALGLSSTVVAAGAQARPEASIHPRFPLAQAPVVAAARPVSSSPTAFSPEASSPKTFSSKSGSFAGGAVGSFLGDLVVAGLLANANVAMVRDDRLTAAVTLDAALAAPFLLIALEPGQSGPVYKEAVGVSAMACYVGFMCAALYAPGSLIYGLEKGDNAQIGRAEISTGIEAGILLANYGYTIYRLGSSSALRLGVDPAKGQLLASVKF
jgi:hypothetical protein